ncbi:unnamed protein product [Callosobruchus maculatus]|uniref:Uncharacterized protein n=1 Tax=Callosobruchus maculatus TaxID=64391 RepID=A0A653C8B1_CALMS|nr:unnamed protein product [Callosobruchus maculatus]
MVKPNLRNIWTPAAPIKRADNIVSSKAREQNNAGFKPTFEKAKGEDMWLVMSNGYYAQWFKERAVYERNTYYKWETIKQEKKVKRRFVQRMMTYRKPTRNEYLEVAARHDKIDFIEHCDYSYYKYKPVLLKHRRKEHDTQKQESKMTEPQEKAQVSEKHLEKSKKVEKKKEPKNETTKAEDSQSACGSKAIIAEFCCPCNSNSE